MGCLQTAITPPRDPAACTMKVEKLLSRSHGSVSDLQRARLTDELHECVDLLSGALQRPPGQRSLQGRGHPRGNSDAAADQRVQLLRARSIIDLLLGEEHKEQLTPHDSADTNAQEKTEPATHSQVDASSSSSELKQRIAELNEELGKVQRICMKQPSAAGEARIVEIELELGGLRLHLRSAHRKEATESHRERDEADEGATESQQEAPVAESDNPAQIRKFFDRYDLDGSGNLSTSEELSCVIMNLVWALEIDALPDQIDRLLADRCQQFDHGGEPMEYEEFLSFFRAIRGRLESGEGRS